MQSGGAGGVPRAAARPHLQCVRLGFRGLFTLRDTLSGRRNCHRVDASCVWMAHMLNQGRVKHLLLEVLKTWQPGPLASGPRTGAQVTRNHGFLRMRPGPVWSSPPLPSLPDRRPRHCRPDHRPHPSLICRNLPPRSPSLGCGCIIVVLLAAGSWNVEPPLGDSCSHPPHPEHLFPRCHPPLA